VERTKPIFMELAGLPAAGKTTTAELLREKLTHLGLRTVVIPEQAARSPLVKLKRNWRFNAWTLCMVVADIVALTQESESDVVIVDRGLVDALCWFAWYRRTREIDENTASVFTSLARIPEWFERLGIVFVLTSAYSTAIHRRREGGRIVNEQTYKELGSAYDEVIKNLKLEESPRLIEVFSTDRKSPSEVAAWALDCVRQSSILSLSSGVI
jgi:thymidylate kinase